MTKLEQQIEDWRKLNSLTEKMKSIIKIKDISEEEKKEILTSFYSEISKYFYTYKTKFDYTKEPR